MNNRKEIVFIVVSDFIAIHLSWFVFYWVRVNSGVFVTKFSDITPSHYIESSIAIYLFWMIPFAFFGLYRSWYVRAPFDEIVTILKTLSIGTIILATVLWWDPSGQYTPYHNDPRVLAATYWLIITAFMVTTRSLIRFAQRHLLEAGVGTRTSIIVGDGVKAQQLAREVLHYPKLGYDIIGFVSPSLSPELSLDSFWVTHRNGKVTEREIRKLGNLEDLEQVIDLHGVKEVLITLESGDHDSLLNVISRASKSNAGLKIVPDLYDIISGQARAREIYGFPLIDVNPVLLRPWEEAAKRTVDILASGAFVFIGLPLWAVIALAIKLSSPGPVIYSQERIGKEGKPYKMYKFRSMRLDAEQGVPQWASKNDPRVTSLGRFLRKSHLDEIPQMLNVLKGDMALVGPRPEREYFVNQLIREIPYYSRRYRVRPGITGLYQATIDKYDENIDDVKMRVKYDLMYIESMSFRMDMKILFRTAYMMLRGKGQA